MRRLRMGLIGGGPGSFIGPIHRIAAEMDREIELVAGCFSSDPGRSREAGDSYRIDPARTYPSLDAMFAGERARDDGIDFVSVVSPNHHHLPAARARSPQASPSSATSPPPRPWPRRRSWPRLSLRRTALCADPYLYGLSAGARGTGQDRGGGAGHDP